MYIYIHIYRTNMNVDQMFENWSDIATEEESNDEYDSSSNNEVDNEVLEIDDNMEAMNRVSLKWTL